MSDVWALKLPHSSTFQGHIPMHSKLIFQGWPIKQVNRSIRGQHDVLEVKVITNIRTIINYPCSSLLGAIQVLRNADRGGGGCQLFQKKALRRCKVQRY